MLKKILSFILCLVTLTSVFIPSLSVSAETVTIQIPDDAVEYNGHYYKAYVDRISWFGAKSACESMGGHLATITDVNEDVFVFELAKITGYTCWIGGTDEKQEGVWEWITGEPWVYEHSGFDNCRGIQHYLVINYEPDGRWDDQSAYHGQSTCCTGGYICEWEPLKKNKYDSVAQYMADVITDKGYDGVWKSKGITPQNNIYKMMLDPDIMSGYLRGIKKEQDNNTVFQAAVFAWEEAELVFQPGSEIVKGPINSVDYYTSIILAVIDCAVNDSFIPDSADNMKDTASIITSNVLDILELDAQKEHDLFAYNKMPWFTDHERKVFANAAWQKAETLRKYSVTSETFFEIYDYSTSFMDFVNKVAALEEAAKVAESILPVLYALDDSCSAITHPEMKAALATVIGACENSFSKGVTMAVEGALTVGTVEITNVIDYMWQSAIAASGCGFGTGAVIGYAVGKTISNFCFSTDATIEQYYALCAMAEFQDIMISATKKMENKFVCNKTTENAANFLAAIRTLENTWLLSTDYAKRYDEIVLTDGFVNWAFGFGNKKDYEEIVASCKNINDSIRLLGRGLLDFEFSFAEGLMKDDYGLYMLYRYDGNIDHSWHGKSVVIACPTDVDMYCGDEHVLSIVSDKVVGLKPGICVYVKDSVKYILLPDDMDFSVKIKGTDSGTMDYTVTEYTDSSAKKVTSFEDVPLMNGCTYDTAIDSVNEDGYALTDENGQTLMPDFISGELAFSSASLTLHNDLCVNYKANASIFDELGYTDLYVKIVFNDEETIIKSYYISDGKYVFDFEGITPDKMNDTIYATLYARYNGVLYASETRQYSVAQYCYNMLGKYNTDEYAEFRTLLVDFLNYGASSQIYTGRNTDALVNSSLTSEQASWATQENPTLKTVMDKEHATVEESSVIWKGAGLNLKDSVAMRFKIECDNIEDISIRVTDDSGAQWVIHNTSFEATEGGYYVYFEGFNAGQMKESVYLTAYDGNTPVSDTVRYSIESYAYSKQNSDDTALVNLLNAMMKYGDSAYSYIN